MAERDYSAIVGSLMDDMKRRDLKAWVQRYSANATHWDPTLPEPMGRENFEESIGVYLRAFPDMTMECTKVFGAGDSLVYEWVGRGTHTGPLAGPQGEIPPTGRRIDVQGCTVIRLNAAGLITEEREYWDSASMMQQLGLMP